MWYVVLSSPAALWLPGRNTHTQSSASSRESELETMMCTCEHTWQNPLTKARKALRMALVGIQPAHSSASCPWLCMPHHFVEVATALGGGEETSTPTLHSSNPLQKGVPRIWLGPLTPFSPSQARKAGPPSSATAVPVSPGATSTWPSGGCV